ncbi:MAG: hypothetical protein HY919_05435 [Elusimicrobia bacterium]|nr:hypothetical protein [Elusimicrobiota bacterium]
MFDKLINEKKINTDIKDLNNIPSLLAECTEKSISINIADIEKIVFRNNHIDITMVNRENLTIFFPKKETDNIVNWISKYNINFEKGISFFDKIFKKK